MPLQDFLTGSNAGYIGAVIGVLVVVFLLWKFFNRESGRLGLEKQEERLTDELKRDETVIEITQRDEKTQCAAMSKAFENIYTRLVATRRSPNEISSLITGITSTLRSLQNEKMNEVQAFNTFKALHGYIQQVLPQLPTDDPIISQWVEGIQAHKNRFYRDLVKEIKLNGNKKKLVRDLVSDIDLFF